MKPPAPTSMAGADGAPNVGADKERAAAVVPSPRTDADEERAAVAVPSPKVGEDAELEAPMARAWPIRR
jgi:hypothetical protein